ncbi:TPA: LysE family translocator [Acinetobacter baumannii]|jgi:threonine/homoserine/homoserine lactone efflux protein|uniref:LysE family translocator n=23 Tax=Gammaproteobacteria TaxID=1236 RepID=A0A219CMK8_ACIBA|nr:MULTISPECIES: LysE family translocator [Acinetobacter]ADX92025.1 putative threonine efflux protein [Acinetobacter baumannii TCDC-AB0715]AHX29779.1 lysine transporter LysE [Acinetobacter baumannii AC12]AHX66805.1 lysine transporter LysE [Acinetobacter baumannii AC30]EXB13219.1 lysE type translocator family protein [Acinetobacter baumannii 1397084]EXC95279.1 lysE type translocator family protein [Acinetobacter baumannii 1051830]EXD24473.1 lysE type translocator family protein [Acinetobacter 
MAFNIFIAFWSVSILFIITPGADWAYAISAGIKGKVVVPAVAGMLFGHFITILLVAAGVGLLVANNPTALMILTVAGSAYLLWMGINLLLTPPTPNESGSEKAQSWLRWATKGVYVSGLNPKVFLLFLALLPQFIDTTASWSVTTQILAFGVVHIISCAIIYLMVGYGSEAILKTRPQAAQLVGRFSGGLMVVIATCLLIGQI